MLGHLLPVLLTSLMHPNLQTLTMADALMPQLVQLVLYTSQVGSHIPLTSSKLTAKIGGGYYKHSSHLQESRKPSSLKSKVVCLGTSF